VYYIYISLDLLSALLGHGRRGEVLLVVDCVCNIITVFVCLQLSNDVCNFVSLQDYYGRNSSYCCETYRRSIMILGSRREILQVTAPCNVARGYIWNVWHDSSYFDVNHTLHWYAVRDRCATNALSNDDNGEDKIQHLVAKTVENDRLSSVW